MSTMECIGGKSDSLVW